VPKEAELEASEKLRLYADLVRQSPHNLLSRAALEELEVRHIPESVAFAATLPDTPRILDLGSGGGLPGLVIAMMRPESIVELVEATGKKAQFLTETAAALDLSVVVHHARAEDLARGALAGAFKIVTARAVAPLVKLAPLAAPFLGQGGRLYAIKGERWREELDAASVVIQRLGLEVVSTPPEEGGADTPRVVVIGRPATKNG